MRQFSFDYQQVTSLPLRFESLPGDPLLSEIAVIATGKSAVFMYRRFIDHHPGTASCPAILIIPDETPGTDQLPPHTAVIHSDHPLMSHRSFIAGAALLEFVRRHRHRGHFVSLLSGGTSALVEYADNERSVIQQNRELLYSGREITEINDERIQLSAIKGGKLTDHASNSRWTTFVMNDIPSPGGCARVGSMPFARPGNENHTLVSVCDSDTLHSIAESQILKNSRAVHRHMRHFMPSPEEAVPVISRAVKQLPPEKSCIITGEIPVNSGDNPKHGGRLSHSMLTLLPLLAKQCRYASALSSDGIDGNSSYAGVELHEADLARFHNTEERKTCLETFDSYTYFESFGGIKITGRTGVNINDVLIFIGGQ